MNQSQDKIPEPPAAEKVTAKDNATPNQNDKTFDTEEGAGSPRLAVSSFIVDDLTPIIDAADCNFSVV